jgi:hypothetical protein
MDYIRTTRMLFLHKNSMPNKKIFFIESYWLKIKSTRDFFENTKTNLKITL